MKQVMSGLGALALVLVVSPSYGDNWERQLRQQEMMMERSAHMNSGMVSQRSNYEIHQNRRMQLERGEVLPRGGVQSIEDIENLPSTAAGRPDARDMDDGAGMKDRRRGHRGEIESTY
ncbi:hypothetical protein MD273_16125 [Marinobacter pelagius]|uniref:hypothetical protein n=1 Tax=Marinobacter sp. C7 TaxID=2951363 RepID=UPI001EEFE7CC|nr:hypothetical protein [Marinobacter sp. C7]MCG7201263.1 hypothetical protein [Marinobacter sp. C7]